MGIFMLVKKWPFDPMFLQMRPQDPASLKLFYIQFSDIRHGVLTILLLGHCLYIWFPFLVYNKYIILVWFLCIFSRYSMVFKFFIIDINFFRLFFGGFLIFILWIFSG